MFAMKEGSQRSEMYTIVILGYNPGKLTRSLSTFSFCEELWPTKYILYVYLWGPYKARGQNGISGSYMYAVFELKAHEASEIWTSLPHTFTKEGLLQLPGQ